MQENRDRADATAPGGQDPPWPTMHPADDYDGGPDPDGPDQRGQEPQEHREDGADQEDGDRGDRRMHDQLGIANDDRAGGV